MAGALDGKVAIITGGTSGIGRATVELFAREGARVVFCARRQADSDEIIQRVTSSGGEARFIQADVAKPTDVEEMVRQTEATYGHVDVILSNAGIHEAGTILDTSEDMWRRIIDVNLGGHFHAAKAGIPALARAGGGSLILTSSELGLVGAKNSAAYCAAKGAVFNFVRAMALDCAAMNVRVNCLAPGAVRTPMALATFNAVGDAPAAEQAQVDPIPMKRLGNPEEIAAAALFLASDASSYMTGSTVLVDGGVTAGYGL